MVIRSEQGLEAARGISPESVIAVKVLFMGELARWAGRREIEAELPEGSTIRELGKKLAVLCGDSFASHALTRAGTFQPHVAVFVDGQHIARRDGAQTVLTRGKVELMLLPTYEGG